METVKTLLEEKYNLLMEVLSLCSNVKVGKDIEENIVYFTELYTDRQFIFDEIKKIDDKIVRLTGDKANASNNKIKNVSKKIYDFDTDYRKSEDEFNIYLNKKLKDIKTTRKLNDKFNHINYEDIGGFSVQG